MHPNHASKRRRREPLLGAEILERRELLTGGAGDTFAIVPGAVTTAGQQATTKFVINASNFTTPKHTITIGIDVVADPNNPGLTPLISTVQQANGKVVPSFHSTYSRKLVASGATKAGGTSAVLTTLRLSGTNPTFTVNIAGQNNTAGKYLLGFYLPGDANGDGTVTMADVKAVKAALGSDASKTSSKYAFDLDANRDGKISAIDLKYTIKNLGVSTTISPVVSANLDQSTDPLLANRVTSKPSVNFTGATSPGATVTFAETAGKSSAVTTTTDSSGNYKITTPLGSGSNTFQVTTHDGFGQSIQGTIAPVSYSTNTGVTAAQLASLEAQASGSAATIAQSTTSTASTSGTTTTSSKG